MKHTSLFRFFAAFAAAAAISAASAPAQGDQEIGFAEEFALAQDREAALAKLIPGTEDYYYYHALHFQNTGQTKKLAEILKQWEKRFRSSNRRETIVRRQALIDYGKNPEKSLEFIRQRSGLTFDHQQEGKARAQQFPSALDQGKITWRKFLDHQLHGTRTLEGISPSEFFPLLKSGRRLTGEERRALLSRAETPDLPGLVKLIAADLAAKESRGFGEFKIHRALTLAQLDELLKLRPELLRNEKFVLARLGKLRPGADTNPAADPAARKAYLDAAWAFAKRLDPSFNSLKAHLLYQRLVFDLSQGTLDRGRFIAYLKLPRNSPCVRPQWRREETAAWKFAADCNRDFRPVTGLPPIGTDKALIRTCLLKFLVREDNYKAYAPWLAENWLKEVFAEAKIVNAVGDPERWASLLSPVAYQSLKDRVDIEFDTARRLAGPDGKPAANALQFGVSDPVRLRLHIKNVPKLIVKIFEIDALNYYLEHGREVSTDIELDGLVANRERIVEYSDPPARRLARDFEFPEIGKRRGLWVVEFIGGGKSSRAVIRKGKLETLTRIVPAGVAVTVIDEARHPVPTAGVWFGGRRFACDKKGRALIPFSNDPGTRSAVIDDGAGFAALARFEHPTEDYALAAGVHVVGESLRPGAPATIVVRPTLTLAGQPVSLTRLHDVRLVLTSTDLDGVTSTTTVSDFKIASDREATHELRTPNRLAGLTVELRAKIKVASRGGKEIELRGFATLGPNGTLRSDRVDDLFLSRIGNRYIVEFLGRTGEPRTGRNLNLHITRNGFRDALNFTLKSDESGAVDLGPLDGIQSVSAWTPDGYKRRWSLPRDLRTLPGTVHAAAGNPVRIPYLGKLDRQEVALFAVSSAGITADTFAKLSLTDGFLVANGLAPGDYQLLLKRLGRKIAIQVAAGEQASGFVFNKARTLELPKRNPAQIASLKADGKTLEISIANADKLTRVHVVATRFLPEFSIFRALGFAPRTGLYTGRPAWLPNLYISGRIIGDEFRYILERRYQQKFPGNMLERPEILLNPWAVRDTEAGAEKLAKGGDFGRQAPGQAGKSRRNGEADPFCGPEDGKPRQTPCFDFLKNPPATLYNLQPDKNGRIRVPLDAFGARQHVHILLIDPDGAAYRQLSLPDRETATRDLRLANALDPARHFTEQDSVTLLKKGAAMEIPDILTARFEVFDNLGAAYRYLLALRDDPMLREFSFVTRWASLKPAEKRENYSKYACHELSFFLAMKDPEFFKTVVRPHLSNKKDRTFLDDYLLGADLSRYFEPYEYARLNAPERILLARRAPGRIEAIRADLRDRLALTPPDPARDNHLFEAALASFGMSTGRNQALDTAKDKLADMAEMGAEKPAPPPSPAAAPRSRKALGSLRKSLGRRSGASRPNAPTEDVRYKIDADEKSRKGHAASKELAAGETKKAKARYGKKAAVPADAFGDGLELGLADGEADAFYRAIKKTREWAENNYWHLPIEKHNYRLITENRFWLDFARHDGKAGFGSRYLGEAARSFHESMLALAVLDLPFEAPEHKTKIEGTKLSFTAGGRAIAFHREIKEAQTAKDAAPLLVSQSWFRRDDPVRIENGEKIDKFVTEEFIVGVVYGGRIVVTNPTGSRRKLDVLIQIPKGAIPVLGHRATVTRRVSLDPYTTQRLETFFYFPAAGDLPCYPAHVSMGGKVVASAETFQFHVVDKPTKVDELSWAYISQWGTEAQVLDYLKTRNLHNIKLQKIAWRCRESDGFTKKTLGVLGRRGVYDATLWSYSLKYNMTPAVRQYLLMQKNFLDSCGAYLKSPLVTIDPVGRRAYQHLEYKPLVNNRAHPVGGSRRILNKRILGQYRAFMDILAQKAALDGEDMLSLTYYLFLQDRTAEALDWLGKVNPKSLPTRLQYDYFQAYAAFCRSQPDAARAIAARYADYPLDRWRERFAAVLAQVAEIDGKSPAVSDEESRAQQQEKRAAEESSLALDVVGTEIRVTFRNLTEVRVNYHEMDLEFLFSTNPFVSGEGGGFSVVRPNKSEVVQLPAGKHEHRFALPREYQSKNVFVEVIGGGKKRSKAIYANELRTEVSENFGILAVHHAKDDRPLPKTYVKVYAMTPNGPKFYKDGYTDLRGKFDYASVSTSDIAGVTKFSLLVMSEDHGATVLEAPVPKR
jgi:hypothetical protein